MNPIPYRSKEITDNYNRINDLRNNNASDNKVTINYSKLDTISAGEIRSKITQALNEYEANYRESMTETTKSYINKLKKANNLSSLEIDYEKFDNTEIALQFRQAIQFVIIKRAREIYLNMTLNPTV